VGTEKGFDEFAETRVSTASLVEVQTSLAGRQDQGGIYYGLFWLEFIVHS
jgi:hypothetical protein